MKISIIIPTFNGRQKINNILLCLEKQEVKPYEVLVLVDGSTDGTISFLESRIFDLPLMIFEQENLGRAKVRNSGAAKARGDLLIFFDDDMRPSPGCLQQHISHHLRFPGSLLTGAQIDDKNASNSSFQQYKNYLSNKWALPLIELENTPLPLKKLHLTAANFSIPKDLFSQLEGFDERLRDAEDFDLAIRAFKTGIPVYYNHKAFSWHDDFVTIKMYIKRLRQYKQAHDILRTLKRELYTDIKLREILQLSGIKSILFSMFANKTLLNAIEKDSIAIRVIPERLRYRLFDLVTTAYGVYFTEKPID